MIETSVFRVTKVKVSSLIWKRRHFEGQFLVLASPVLAQSHFPNSPHFSLPLVPTNTIQNNIVKKTRSCKHQFNCLLTWIIRTRVCHCLHAVRQTAQKTASHCDNASNFKHPNPLEFNQATPNAYQMPCVCATA